MHRRKFVALGFAVAGSGALKTALAQTAAGGWVTLFDGKSLDGWSTTGDPNITLADGVVQADKGNGHLVWKDAYEDFELRAEIWINADANSGVFVRFPDKTKPSSKEGYEFNIFDARPDPSYGTGAIVDTAKAATALKAAGKWSLMEITCKGSQLSFKLDGVTTVDKASNSANGHVASARGYISLQFGGGLVRFRKVEIRVI
jgi:Domain of Unknown Function (DUF1080)